MIAYVWGYIAPFGWPICLVLIISYILYSQTIKPKLDQVLEEQRIIEQKKFDEDLNLRFAQRITAVREKQQLEHDFISQEEKRIAEENARKKLKELEEASYTEIFASKLGCVTCNERTKKSVLEATLLTHDLNVHKKKAPDSTRSPSELIDAFISSKPIVVFSKTWCQFCRKAKAALATYRLNQRYYEYIELDERTDLPSDEIIDELGRRYGSKSVPKVFIGGEFIGGADDVVQLLHDVWGYIAPFGWPICLVLIISYILYSQTIKPKLDQLLEEQRIIEQKKFDEDLNLRFAQRITAVREKQQLEHDFISQEEKRIAEENARKKLKELEERERKKSVLEATLLTHDLNVHKKKAPDSTRSPSELIDAFISSKPIVVFSKTWCQFCRTFMMD
ncbi:glutaredoxin [Ancylostoma duodenale]|uniref:Glutaredoxin n=1 Tax=Ancylostoma duodenale TaxID=51022 RepID=A0A0C2GBM9_9BILA|nr:glutaredoxin [Ancylostoma duodenale]